MELTEIAEAAVGNETSPDVVAVVLAWQDRPGAAECNCAPVEPGMRAHTFWLSAN